MARPKPLDRRRGHGTRLEVVASPGVGDLPAPASLGIAGRRVWGELWSAGGGVYRPELDSIVIARYCELTDRREHLRSRVESEGYTVAGSQGQEVAHPAARMLLETEKELRQLEGLLGLNPTDRARLGLTATRGASKLDQIRQAREARA
jgi:P27 family predicted phage terminase small subunit